MLKVLYYNLVLKKNKGEVQLTIHLIMGMTIGTHRIAEALKRRNVDQILVVDEFHEGAPHVILGLMYCSEKQAEKICKEYSTVIHHYFSNPSMDFNIQHFHFR